MGDVKQIEEVAKALGLPSLLPAVYNDLLSPAARELGDGLATVAKAVKIALAPIEATVWGYDKVREWLSMKVTSILAGRGATEIISAPLSISGPLTLQMIFASDEPELRAMYANLLASSMDARLAGTAHPSFVSLIQQLTSDEAKIIKQIASLKTDFPNWHGDANARLGSDSDLWGNLRAFCRQVDIDRPENADLYIQNLIRLRLLRHGTGAEAIYHPAGTFDYREPPDVSTKEYEWVELTEYGQAFLLSCVLEGEGVNWELRGHV